MSQHQSNLASKGIDAGATQNEGFSLHPLALSLPQSPSNKMPPEATPYLSRYNQAVLAPHIVASAVLFPEEEQEGEEDETVATESSSPLSSRDSDQPVPSPRIPSISMPGSETPLSSLTTGQAGYRPLITTGVAAPIFSPHIEELITPRLLVSSLLSPDAEDEHEPLEGQSSPPSPSSQHRNRSVSLPEVHQSTDLRSPNEVDGGFAVRRERKTISGTLTPLVPVWDIGTPLIRPPSRLSTKRLSLSGPIAPMASVEMARPSPSLRVDYRRAGRICLATLDTLSFEGYLCFQVDGRTDHVVPRVRNKASDATPVLQIDQTATGDFKLVIEDKNGRLRRLGFREGSYEWNFRAIFDDEHEGHQNTPFTDVWSIEANCELLVRWPMNDACKALTPWNMPTAVAFKWEEPGDLSGLVVDREDAISKSRRRPPPRRNTRLFFEPI